MTLQPPEGGLPPDHPVNRLRRLADVLEIVTATAGCDTQLADDAGWLAAAVRRYDADAPIGVSLAEAFGMKLQAGDKGWWRLEARGRPDALIRQVYATYFADLDLAGAAKEIRAAAARCARSRRRPEAGPGALLAEAGRFMAIPQSPKMVREILEMK